MSTIYRLSVLILTAGVILTASSKYVSYIAKSRNMKNAAAYCQTKCHGDLLRIDNKTLQRLPEIVPENKELWVGYHTTESKWIQILGCFKEESLIPNSYTRRLVFNEVEYQLFQNDRKMFVATCQVFCHPSTDFAVKMRICMCFDKAPDSAEMVSSTYCYANNIKFNPEDSYVMFFNQIEVTASTDDDCGQMYCKGKIPKRLSYSCDDSTKPYYYCVNENRQLQLQPYNNSWDTSLNGCLRNGRYLALFHDLSCDEIDDSKDYWIGEFLFRKSLQLASEGKLSGFTDNTECGYVKKTTSGTELNMKSCSSGNVKKFICEFESISGVNTACKMTYFEIAGQETSTITTQKSFPTSTHVPTSTQNVPQWSSTDEMDTTSESFFNNTDISATKAYKESNLAGPIAGTLVGVVLPVTIIVVLALIWWRRKKNKMIKSDKKAIREASSIVSNAGYELQNDFITTEENSHSDGKNTSVNQVTDYTYANNNSEYEFATPLPNDNSATYYNMPPDRGDNTDSCYYESNIGEYDNLGGNREHKGLKVDNIYDSTNDYSSDVCDRDRTNLDKIDLYDHVKRTEED